jgi:hypothetical protein
VTRASGGRRGPLQKLRDAPRAVKAAERAVVEPGIDADRKHQPYCPSGRW